MTHPLIGFSQCPNVPEICNNGIDDDCDGLVDCFDGNCSGNTDCSTFYFGKDSGDCQIAPPVVTGYNLVEKWRSVVDVETRGTPIVGDLDGDGIPEVITHFRDDNTVYILDGATGTKKYTINAHLSEYSQSPAIADVDNDGFGEIFLVDHFGKLRCFDHQGNPKVGFNEITISKGQGTFQGVYSGNPSFADFNGDGISEIFIGNQIFNAITGLVTAELPNPYNESKGAIGVNGHMYSAAFDILPDNFCTDCSGMELICGNVVYSVNVTTGVMTKVSEAPSNVNDGKVSLADWDGDNQMDIIVSGTCCGDGGVIYIWDPRTQNFVTHDAQGNILQANPIDVQPNQSSQVGLASIADFDGDGFLEIGMAGRNEFITIESNMTRKWAIPVVDQSNMTTSTAFDFEGDGKTEVVYRDENFLYILDGETGNLVTKVQCGSGTRTELPIVVDVNGDGDAELVCTCSDINGAGKGQVRVYESDSTIWVPTRKVWNTHNYVPTFINDDLSIPIEFQNKALIDGQDLYLAQTSLTYKSGNSVYPVLPDYTITLDSVVMDCNQNEGLAHVKVCQINTDALVFDFDISFYKGDPLTGGSLIGTKHVDHQTSTIPSTGCMITNQVVDAENYDLHVYVNDQGTNSSNVPVILMPECDTTNNLTTYSMSTCNKDCETPIIGSVDAKIAAWQYIGEVSEGLNYELEAISGSNSFIATDGPDAGKDVFAVVFNTSHGGQVSLNRTRYYSNDKYRDVLTGTYDNSPHGWTGLNGGEKAPILGYIAFIDLDGNGVYNSGTDIYYRDVNSLSFDALANGDLYMAFYDDGTYSDNSSTITVSSTATNCPTDLAISKTDGVSVYQRSSNTTYTIVAKNNGPVDIKNATVSDPIPNGINSFTWTAVLHGTATNSAGSSGGGTIIDNVDLAVGDSIVYTVTAAVSGTKFGDLENTVTISTPNGTKDLDSTNNIAIDIDADPDPTSCFILMTDFEDYVNCTAPSYDLFTQAYAGNSSWVNSNHTAGLFVNDPGICTNTNGLILPHIDGGNAYAGLHSPLNGNTQEVIIGTLPTNLFANQEYEISFIGVSILVRNQAIWDEYGEVEFFGIEEGTNPVLNTITQKNGTTIRAIPEVDHIGTSTTVNSRTQWNEYSFKFTPTRNYDRLLLAPRGNFAYVGIDNIVVKVAAQDIEIDTVTICSGTTNTVLPYNIISGTPDEYAIDWDAAANTAGITDIAQTTLPIDSQFVLSGLGTVPVGAYTAEISVFNTLLGCEGVDSVYFEVIGCKTDLGVTKTDGKEDYTPGTTTGYTIVVKNYGPSDAIDVIVDDPLPTGISIGDVSWDAITYGGAISGVIGSQVGGLNDIVSIPIGDSIVYSVNFAIPGNYKGDLVNTVSISSNIDTNAINDIATDINFNGLCVGATISSFEEQFNTGVKINPGQNDPNWKIQWIKDPTYYFYPANNYATPTNNNVIPAVGMNKAANVWADAAYPDYLWVCYPWVGTNNGPGKHIDVDRDGISQEYSGGAAISGTGDAVTLKFSKTFEMTAAQLEASELSFSIAADNQIMDIIVNGVSQGPKALGGYQLTPHTITQDFQLGTNTIEIVVNSGPGYAGMMIANSTIKAVDSVSLVVTDPPLDCAPISIDITDSLWTFGSINVNTLTYFIDDSITIPFTTPTVADSGIYYIVATNLVGCSDTAVINVGSNPNPDVELRTDTVFCEGGNVTIDAGLFDSWNWNVGGKTGQTITVDSTYEYKVVVTNSFNCSDSDSVVVTVNPLPIVKLRNDTAICFGDSLDLDAKNTTASYLWNTSETTQTIKIGAAGTYEVTVTDTNSCLTVDEMILSIHALPIVQLRNDTIVCDPEVVVVDAGVWDSYLWSNGNTTNQVTLTTNDTVYVDIIDANSCAGSDTIGIQVIALPIVDLGNDTAICDGESVILDAENPGLNYNWNTTETTQTISIDKAGSFGLEVTDQYGCLGSDSMELSIYALPVVFIGNDTIICEPESITINAGNWASYFWNNRDITKEVIVDSTVQMYVSIKDVNGCAGSDTINIQVNPIPIVDLGNDTTICINETVTLDARNPGWNYVWNLGETTQTITVSEGFFKVIVSDSIGCNKIDSIKVFLDLIPDPYPIKQFEICEGENINLEPDTGFAAFNINWPGLSTNTFLNVDEGGEYYSAVTSNYCTDTFMLTVTKIDTPDIALINILGRNTACFDNESISLLLVDSNLPLSSYEWSTGEITSEIIVTEEGNYYVNVTNIACEAIKEIAIKEYCLSQLYIPNAFTPNGEGLNDIFIPIPYGEITNYQLLVFDRWGEEIFSTKDLNVGWDGTYKGNPCQIDVYVYKATYDFITENQGIKTKARVGTVTLLR